MVKVCGITNLEDANVAVEHGAAAVGFVLAPSPRRVTVEQAAAIVAELPGQVLKVGVFVDATAEEAASAALMAGFDVVQLHGKFAPAVGQRIWRAVAAAEGVPEDAGEEALLMDTAVGGGTGRTFDWTLARVPGRRVIVAGGLDGSNVGAAIDAARPWGVDASSRLEREPGRKDHRKVMEFLAAAHEAARRYL